MTFALLRFAVGFCIGFAFGLCAVRTRSLALKGQAQKSHSYLVMTVVFFLIGTSFASLS